MIRILLLGLSMTLMYSAPLVLSAMGGVVSMRSGVDNIGLEGMMTIGAFVATTVGYFSGNPWFGFFMGGVAGMLLSVLHGIVSISLKGNQIISGIAINFIGPGAAIFLSRLLFDGATQTYTVSNKIPKLFASLGVTNPILRNADIDATVLVALLSVVALWYFLYYTKAGLRVRACGEHPAAADTVGVNVSLVRYLCVLASGFLSGLGGAAYTLAIISNFTPTVISGQGFIALAAVIFGNWRPIGAALGCLLFGFAQALIIMLAGSFIPSQILAMLPYAITLFVLIFVKKSDPPKANGVPYFKGQA